jgi:pyruvate/2-oxoglutarate dehydrogenase complex dihydrolipoamide dehydrogenase (E3) component
MAEPLRPDLCIIGAGSGGLSLAAAAGAMGVPTVLIEKGRMGGDCLNTGCVPSKSLIAAAKAAQEMRSAGRFGLIAREPEVDFARVQAHVRAVIEQIAPTDSEARFKALGVRVIHAPARFTARNRVEAGGETILARRFVVATGSTPILPPIPGIETIRSLTTDSIFDLAELPSHLIIIGGGPVSMELAQAFRRLGSAVTVLEAERCLSREDPELAAIALEALRSEGVMLREGVRVTRIDPLGPGLRLWVEGEHTPLDGSHLLVATGRRPNVEALGLEAAGIVYGKPGIKVGRNLRTSNRRVYAVGDVAGGAQFTHAANYHAGLVLRAALFRLPVKLVPAAIPRVTFTDPEIAVAGLTEAQARAAGHKINVLRWPFAENDRAQAERQTRGHIKVIAAPGGKVLGAGIVGANAGELIGLWQMAVDRGLKIKDIAALVLPYPTLAEVSRRAAISSFTASLRNPWLGRVLRFLRKFG